MLSPHRNGRAEVPEVPSQDEALARFGYRHDHGIGEIQADVFVPVEHLERAKVLQIYAGTDEIQVSQIARSLLAG